MERCAKHSGCPSDGAREVQGDREGEADRDEVEGDRAREARGEAGREGEDTGDGEATRGREVEGTGDGEATRGREGEDTGDGVLDDSHHARREARAGR